MLLITHYYIEFYRLCQTLSGLFPLAFSTVVLWLWKRRRETVLKRFL
jgi:hypothetical protein